jgi:aconitase A
MQDARYAMAAACYVKLMSGSAQMALLQFSTAGATSSAVPASIHCDHLISAFEGAEADLKRGIVSNKEVFDFLESAFVVRIRQACH